MMDGDQDSTFITASRASGDQLMKRRDLLQRAAWILPASLFPMRWASAAQDVSPVMAKLSTYMADARTAELPDKIVQDAKHHILEAL